MSPKAEGMRADAELSPAESPRKPLGSDSECSNSRTNRIQTRSWRGLETCTETERRRIEARFWAHVKKSDGCWVWTWSCQKARGGHGQLRCAANDRIYLLKTHRLAWEIAYGPIPDTLQINHRCENGICVRPEHLYLGTQQENLNDARRSGRLNERRPRTGKLIQADRLAIYHMPDRRGLGVELALRYRVSKVAISLIRSGRFAGSPLRCVFERVPHRQVPIRGEVA